VLSGLCTAGRSTAGAVDLAAFSRTCRAVGLAQTDGSLSAAHEAARLVLRAACDDKMRKAAARRKPPAEDEQEGPRSQQLSDAGAGSCWMRTLHHHEMAQWASFEPATLDSLHPFCTAISPGVALERGATHMVTGGTGLGLWAVHADQVSCKILPGVLRVDVLALSHSGLVATASNEEPGVVRIHDLADGGALRRTVRTGCASISSLLGCGDKVLAAGEDTLIACFDAISGEVHPALLSHAPGQACLAACSSTVAVACSGRIHLFEQECPSDRPQRSQVLRSTDNDDIASSSAIALLPSGILAAADWYGEVHVWSRQDDPVSLLGERWVPRMSFDALDESTDTEGEIYGCLSLATCLGCFLATGHVWGTSIKLWNVFDGTLVARLAAPDGCLCFGVAESMILAASGGGGVTVWKPRSSSKAGTQEATSGLPTVGARGR